MASLMASMSPSVACLPSKTRFKTSSTLVTNTSPYSSVFPSTYLAVESATKDVLDHKYSLDRVVERIAKAHSKWGARDRRTFAALAYDLVRHWRYWLVVSGQNYADGMGCQGVDIRRVIDVMLECHGQVKLLNERTLAEQYSMPDWLMALGAAQCGDELWASYLPALQSISPVYLRVNLNLTTVESLRSQLAQEGIQVEYDVGRRPETLRLEGRPRIFASSAFHSGAFEMQDAHSQEIAPFLDVSPGMRVVDACAGAGGKTLHLSVLMRNKGRLVAMDTSRRRLDELRLRARRARVSNLEIKLIESTKVTKRLDRSFDRLLLDVPCSGIGVLSRNPDQKWRITEGEVIQLQRLQDDILSHYSRMVKVGGKMVYATCSVLPCENQDRVSQFASEFEGSWELEEDRFLPPQVGGGNGFYMARLRRLK